MSTFGTSSRALPRTTRCLFIGGFALFGCSSTLERPGCDDHDCAASAGAGSGNGAGNGAMSVGTVANDGGGGRFAGTSGAAGGITSGGGNAGGDNQTMGGTTGSGGSLIGSSGAAGTSAGGGTPLICPDGTFDHDGNPNNFCKAWTTCRPGQFVAKSGTDTVDRVCAICADGTFSATNNVQACSPWTDCAPDSYLTKAGTAIANQQCSACPSASSTEASQCYPPGVCLVAGGCNPGTVQTSAGGASPVRCTACSRGDYCIGGLSPALRCASGTWDSDADPATCCSPWSSCSSGTYISKAGSATANRECSSCPPGTFSVSSNALSCSPWKECPASSTWPQGGVSKAGTASSDVVCADPYYTFGAAVASAAFGVAVDSSGNVYVVGTTSGMLAGPLEGASDVFVRKFDAKGATLWTRQFGSLNTDQGAGVAVDGSGNVYVIGRTFGGGMNGGFIRKLDANGGTLWTRPFGDGQETPAALAVDAVGSVYVAGTDYPHGQSSGEAYVRKIDANGVTSWTQRFGGPDEDVATAVAVDGSGGAFVAGYTSGLVSNEGQRDGFVRKFSPSGATLWTRQFGTTDADEVSAARVDGNGNLYVVGSSGGGFGGAITGSLDAFVRKFDASGSALWTKQVGGAGYQYGVALGVDGSNNAFVVGSTDNAFVASNAGGMDIYARKFDPSGAVLSTQQIGTAFDDNAQGAMADASGNLYIVGYKGEFDNGEAIVLQIPALSF